ncbi:MAG: ABC transporter ATP-binding protein [Gammaproteobacteria bacterium]|nr:ABC transporter ATP-binding protein [Gammaproteobacteria bacterium]
MAEIRLDSIRHSYEDRPSSDADYALKHVDLTWNDGGAYALLGPSGCGKSTLLNIISGLLIPTEGDVLFDGRSVFHMAPGERNIAQVFQFPVVYDTMTVYRNLAFPLRNRGMDRGEIDRRVRETARMLGLEDSLDRRAAGLTADNKQKISLARGLVRSDVNVIMFDEPLTVIDPHLKWQLRAQLKKLHQRYSFTMIYVTHDQTEALTFADRIVVMHEGEVVQIGTSEDLFERPQHTFVGHFIGSPGMNLFPCEARDDGAWIDGRRIPLDSPPPVRPKGAVELGVRPEFIRFDNDGVAVEVRNVADIGRYRIVDALLGEHPFKIYCPEDMEIPSADPRVVFDPRHASIYVDGWRAEGDL